jgi:hypothetical protein
MKTFNVCACHARGFRLHKEFRPSETQTRCLYSHRLIINFHLNACLCNYNINPTSEITNIFQAILTSALKNAKVLPHCDF